MGLLRGDELLAHIEDAVYVVVVDVTNNQEVHWQRRRTIVCSRAPDLREARLQVRFVNERWPAVDQCEPRIRLRTEMQKGAVTFSGAAYLETENHRRAVRCSGTRGARPASRDPESCALGRGRWRSRTVPV